MPAPQLVAMFRRTITGEDEDAEQPIAGSKARRTGKALTGGRCSWTTCSGGWRNGSGAGRRFRCSCCESINCESLVEQFGAGAASFLHRVLERMLEAATRDMDERCEFQNGEFAILLPGVDEANALAVAERLQSQVRQCKVRMGDALWNITASIGLTHPEPGSTVVDVVQSAELALRKANERGGDAICVGEAPAGKARGAAV